MSNAKVTEPEVVDIAEGGQGLLEALVGYAKRYNGYRYISASRIERIPKDSKKYSVLFQQLYIVYLTKKQTEKDFMDVFGKGNLIFIQAHTECPTLAEDGLYDQVTIDGRHIKTQIVGHFAIDEGNPVETHDERSNKDRSYWILDGTGSFIDLGVNDDIPLAEYYKKYTKIYSRDKRPAFEPCILVAKAKNEYGIIHGNPYHVTTAAEVGALLKDQVERTGVVPPEVPEKK